MGLGKDGEQVDRINDLRDHRGDDQTQDIGRRIVLGGEEGAGYGSQLAAPAPSGQAEAIQKTEITPMAMTDATAECSAMA